MLRNAVGGVRIPRNRVMKVYVISITRGWVGVKYPGENRYATLEWLLSGGHIFF